MLVIRVRTERCSINTLWLKKLQENEKVERSHRNAQEHFYDYLSFYSFDDLQIQMKRYLQRSNNISMAVLGWKSPNQKHKELGNA